MSSIVEKVEKLVKPKIEKIGYELYDVEYAKEGKSNYLRIYIDSPKGIDLNDCETVNNAIIDMLDEADYIKDQYFLEISSPGIERVLRKDEQLKKYIGEEVQAKLFQKDESGKKEYQGILKEFNEEQIIIDEKIIKRKNIAQLKTVYDWNKEREE